MVPQLTVIIPSKNRVSILEESLHHLKNAIKNHMVEVLVINDGDEELHQTMNRFPWIRIHKNQGSGVGAARNYGAQLARAEILLFLDDDIWVGERAIERLLELHRDDDNMALNFNWVYPIANQEKLSATAFGRYLEKNNFTTLKGWNRDTEGWDDEKIFSTASVTSQNLSVRKLTFLSTGGYNENFPHAGFEDFEFSKKIISSGVKIKIDPTIMTYHNEADRMDLIPWLKRKRRGGETRAVAVALGYKELKIEYSLSKSILLQAIYFFQPLIVLLINNRVSNTFRVIDGLSFRLIGGLLATAIFKGYTAK